jgi:hypothetical protein
MQCKPGQRFRTAAAHTSNMHMPRKDAIVEPEKEAESSPLPSKTPHPPEKEAQISALPWHADPADAGRQSSAPRIRTPEAYTGSSGHRSPGDGASNRPQASLPFGMPSVRLPLLRGSRTPQSGWLPRGIADAEQRGHVTAARESILYCIPTGSDMSASIILCNKKKKNPMWPSG